ncbi:MAG: TetR/AcrR family transcriptional regulator [Bacteroidia bacterium]
MKIEQSSFILFYEICWMGTTSRKAKEKEALKERILSVAQKLFVELGVERTTIRNIAQEVACSVGTVYVYFRDKNEILHELHRRGFAILGANMAALQHVGDPFERLKALGRVYLAFALENQLMYDLMFNMKAPMDVLRLSQEEKWREGMATFGVLRNTITDCMKMGYFKGHQVEALAFAIWSAVHGMCSLFIRERIQGVSEEEPLVLMHRAYDSLVSMLAIS